jgi:hypothetical protein
MPARRRETKSRLLSLASFKRWLGLQKGIDRRRRSRRPGTISAVARRRQAAARRARVGGRPASAQRRRAQSSRVQALARLERVASRVSRPSTTAAARSRRAAALSTAITRRYRAENPSRRKRRKTNPRKRTTTMARLARNRKGQFLPRGSKRRRRRRSSGHHTTRRRRRVSHARRPAVVLVNPRRRRRRSHSRALVRHAPRRHRRRARNPSMGGLVRTAKAALIPMGLGAAAGGVAGFMDAKFLAARPTVSILLKLALGVAGAAVLGRRRPAWAMGWAGGMMGSTGYYAGVKMAGGLVALSPQAALKGIADMAAEDPEMAAQIAGLAGMGDVVDDNGLGDAADEYNEALGDDDDMGDVVDAD